MAQLQSVEVDLRELLVLEPLRDRVTRLRCFRGIDDLTALTIAAELGDPRRFPTAPSVMAFVGLVPSAHPLYMSQDLAIQANGLTDDR